MTGVKYFFGDLLIMTEDVQTGQTFLLYLPYLPIPQKPCSRHESSTSNMTVEMLHIIDTSRRSQRVDWAVPFAGLQTSSSRRGIRGVLYADRIPITHIFSYLGGECTKLLHVFCYFTLILIHQNMSRKLQSSQFTNSSMPFWRATSHHIVA